jgi:hypothetical protein
MPKIIKRYKDYWFLDISYERKISEAIVSNFCIISRKKDLRHFEFLDDAEAAWKMLINGASEEEVISAVFA